MNFEHGKFFRQFASSMYYQYTQHLHYRHHKSYNSWFNQIDLIDDNIREYIYG